MNSLLVHTCSKQSLLSTKLIFTVKNSGRISAGQTLCGQSNQNLKGEVISLYKNLIYLSRDWHTDLRPQIKGAFKKNRDVRDPDEIRKLLDKGDYICREIIATYNLKKYRAMKRRYYSDDQDKHLQELIDSLKDAV